MRKKNYLDGKNPKQRSLPEREATGGKVRVLCPGCDQWRPGFCLTQDADGWRCDGCRSAALRAELGASLADGPAGEEEHGPTTDERIALLEERLAALEAAIGDKKPKS